MDRSSSVRLTKTIAEKAEVRDTRYDIWDVELTGFGLRVEKSGTKTFIIRYRTDGGGRSAPRRFLTVGRFGTLTVDQARKKAKTGQSLQVNGALRGRYDSWEASILWSRPMGVQRSVAILDHFSALSDPREGWRVVYPLPEILLVVLCATLSGMEDFVEIRLWGEQRLDFLRRFLSYERGLPAHDTLNDVINALDADLFKACFAAWVEALRDGAPDIIAVDGKTSRRSHGRSKGRAPLHLVSAWASRQRLVLGQEATDAKSNEITAIPLLLERLELTGALVTIDAMGTQAAVAETIVRRGGDYLLALKGNRSATHADVVRFFDDPPADLIAAPCETTDADHGRLEHRRHVVCHDVSWLWSDRRYAGEPRFPHLAMIGMVETTVERAGKTQHERRYYLSSAKLDAKTFAAAVRAHWHIENRLHWVLDVVFHDDLARLRTGAGPQNMAVVKHMAMNLVRTPTDKHSLKVRRKLANLNPDYLEKLIRAQYALT